MRRYLSILSILVLCGNVIAEVPVEEKNAGDETPAFELITEDINDRLTRIERALENKALLDMLALLESLKLEVSELRGQIEVQTHTIEQLQSKQRDLYTDVDQRLQTVEAGKPAYKPATTAATTEDLATKAPTTATPATDQAVENQAGSDETRDHATAPDDTQNETLAVSTNDDAKAETAYQRAFKLLRESQYDAALQAFKAFLGEYPDSPFSDNAQYWLAETNYVNQNYQIAINEYQALLGKYPDSQKISHAKLKIGYSYAELGNAKDARKTLEEVIELYPGTTAARLADERLRRIDTNS